MSDRHHEVREKDADLVARLWNREENALTEIQTLYGTYCRTVALGILHDEADADETVNDTLLAAWNSIPPHRPENLAGYLGKLCRRLSVTRLRQRTADKRGGGEVPLALDELSETVGDCALSDADEGLSEALDAFLRTLPETERRVFLCRYFYADSVKDVTARFGFGESKVKMMLLRTREKLRAYLQKEGYFV